MKKFLCGAFAIAASIGSAAAQTQVVIYGLFDTGIEYVNHANAAGNSVVRMPSLTGSLPSRIGLRGTEDLGGDLKALFVLESGIAPDTGALGQGNRLFGRQSYVGLKNSYGTLMLGRQINMTYMSLLKADVMGPNIHGMSNIDPYLPNARTDNAIGYLGAFSEFTIGVTYSLGRDASSAGGPAATNCPGEVPGDSKACRQTTAMLAYDNAFFGMATAYDILYGNAGAANGLTSSSFYDERISLNGYVFLGQAKLGLGVIDRKTHTLTDTRSDIYYLGISYPFLPSWSLDTQISRLNVKGTGNQSTLLTARAIYNFSRRTSAYTSVGYIRNGGAAAIPVDAGGSVPPGTNQTGLMVGIRHFF